MALAGEGILQIIKTLLVLCLEGTKNSQLFKIPKSYALILIFKPGIPETIQEWTIQTQVRRSSSYKQVDHNSCSLCEG